MSQTEQMKGQSHIDYINELAISYWAKLKWSEGEYPQCLRDAMKEHRDYLICCVKERRKIVQERYPKCEDCFTPLDQNDIFHYGLRCHDCFQVKFVDACTASGVSIPMA